MPVSTEATDSVDNSKVGAIVVAAGESKRMVSADKIFVPLIGQPLIAHCLKSLHDSTQIDAIVLVMSSHNVERGRQLVEANGWRKVIDVCAGGNLRQDSVRIGLERLADAALIIVHDGARPFIDEGMSGRSLREAAHTGAATAAVPVKDTIKSADAEMFVTHTIERNTLWSAQTPQVFRRQLLVEAHERVTENVTDDASMIEQIGGKVRLFMGSYSNIKITTPEDLPMAEAILNARAQGASIEGP